MDKEMLKLILVAAMGVVALAVFWGIYRRSRDEESPLNLDHLLMERGADGTWQLSKIGCYLLGSFLVSSWVVVSQTLQGELSDFVFGIYCATWIAPLIVVLAKKAGVDIALPSLPNLKKE